MNSLLDVDGVIGTNTTTHCQRANKIIVGVNKVPGAVYQIY